MSSIAALQEDFYANSSQASQASLWNTWTTLATAWGLPSIPITRELLLSVGASMKHAGYRSHKNYFYKAAQVHRETLGQDIPPDPHLLMQKILRSIKRGQGPTPFKDAFELELFHVPLQRRLDITRTGHSFNDRFAARDITMIACWWMLRGIEAAAARFQHIWFHETNITRFVYFTLPVQKNDPTGLCVTRGHPCICKTGEPNALCPFHAMQQHMKRIHHLFRDTPPEHLPLIPTDEGDFATKSHIMKIFSSAIGLTETPLTRPGPRGEPLPRFGEHVCRVSGAQFLSRMGYSLEAILIGRWGSDAVKRYIQEAPLAATPSHMVPSTSPPIHPTSKNWCVPNSHAFAIPGGSLAKVEQSTYQPYLRRHRIPDGEHSAVGTTAQPHIKRPGIDQLTTFVGNVSVIWRTMTMELHPKTSFPRT